MSASDQMQIRPARPDDFDAVQAISVQIWEGSDYIPRVWEKWLADPEGAFVVATIADRVVGLAKLTRLAAREWWLHGACVDPAYRRRGVGKAMSTHLLRRFRELGRGMARFVTGSHNVAVHRMAKRDGSVKQTAFVSYEALPQPLHADEFRALTPAAASAVWDYLRTSAKFKANTHSYAKGWTWYFLTQARLREELQAGRVYGWFGDRHTDALDGVVIVTEPDEDREGNSRLRVAYLDVTEGKLAIAAQWFRAVAGHMSVSKLQVKTLAYPEQLAALAQAGYQRAWEHEIWLYALDERGEDINKGGANG